MGASQTEGPRWASGEAFDVARSRQGRSTPSSPRPSSARCIRRRRRASPPPQAQRRPRRQLRPALLGASPSRP